MISVAKFCNWVRDRVMVRVSFLAMVGIIVRVKVPLALESGYPGICIIPFRTSTTLNPELKYG